jgi:hypothetical protein
MPAKNHLKSHPKQRNKNKKQSRLPPQKIADFGKFFMEINREISVRATLITTKVIKNYIPTGHQK